MSFLRLCMVKVLNFRGCLKSFYEYMLCFHCTCTKLYSCHRIAHSYQYLLIMMFGVCELCNLPLSLYQHGVYSIISPFPLCHIPLASIQIFAFWAYLYKVFYVDEDVSSIIFVCNCTCVCVLILYIT